FNFVRDIAPVASIMRVPLFLVVHPSFPAKTVPELIAYANANPGKLNFASSGNGAFDHVAGARFKMYWGGHTPHVSYTLTPTAPALPDLLGGQVEVYFASVPASIEYIRAGKLRALAVTAATRWEALPDIPALGESLPGYEAILWSGVGVPKKTPTEIVEKLNK